MAVAVAKLMRKSPWSARFGLVIILLYAFVAIFAPVLTPYGESEIVGAEFEPWGETYILGTDNLGRDMMTRLIYGARNTIGIALATTCLAFFIGALFGFTAAAVGGWLDQLISRVVDVLMAIPPLIFALLILTIGLVRSGRVDFSFIPKVEADRVTASVSINRSQDPTSS